jgi:predicted CoA-binding protein
MSILKTDLDLRSLLERARTIAVVGLSANPERDSYQIGYHLVKIGYRIIPVNPTIREVFGLTAVAGLDDIKEHVDIVNIFRRPEAVPEIIDAAIRLGTGAIWMQLGVATPETVKQAVDAGLDVVYGRCIMVEHRRLNR